jgi:hypothetical protein
LAPLTEYDGLTTGSVRKVRGADVTDDPGERRRRPSAEGEPPPSPAPPPPVDVDPEQEPDEQEEERDGAVPAVPPLGAPSTAGGPPAGGPTAPGTGGPTAPTAPGTGGPTAPAAPGGGGPTAPAAPGGGGPTAPAPPGGGGPTAPAPPGGGGPTAPAPPGTARGIRRFLASRGGKVASVVVAGSVVAGAFLGTRGGSPSIEGEWVVQQFNRQAGVVLEDVPETLPAERWVISKDASCEGSGCPLELTTTALEGAPRPIHLELRPASDGTHLADLDFVSQCINPDTGQVLETEASNVHSTYRVRVAEGPVLDIVFEWDGSPTNQGLAAGCDIRSARFVATGRPAPDS